MSQMIQMNPNFVENRRPGKLAAIPDQQLCPEDLERRNRVRQRNKEAAQRVRDRRLQKMHNLELKIAQLEQEKKMLEEDNMILRCALMVKNSDGKTMRDPTVNFHRQISNTDLPIAVENPVMEIEDFQPAAAGEINIEIYANGDGQSALMLTAETAFVLTPIRHQIQLTVTDEPKRPANLAQFNDILKTL